MNKLHTELAEAAKTPKMSAVKFSKANEAKLTLNFGVTRQHLRQVAVLVDKMAGQGHVFVEEEKVKVSKKKEEKKVEKKVVETATVKPKPKKKAKKASKKKKG